MVLYCYPKMENCDCLVRYFFRHLLSTDDIFWCQKLFFFKFGGNGDRYREPWQIFLAAYMVSVSSHVAVVNTHNKVLIAKRLKQDNRDRKLRKAFSKLS